MPRQAVTLSPLQIVFNRRQRHGPSQAFSLWSIYGLRVAPVWFAHLASSLYPAGEGWSHRTPSLCLSTVSRGTDGVLSLHQGGAGDGGWGESTRAEHGSKPKPRHPLVERREEHIE